MECALYYFSSSSNELLVIYPYPLVGEIGVETFNLFIRQASSQQNQSYSSSVINIHVQWFC